MGKESAWSLDLVSFGAQGYIHPVGKLGKQYPRRYGCILVYVMYVRRNLFECR